MNKVLSLTRVFVMAAFLVVAAQTSLSADSTEPIVVINDTGRPIKALYIVPRERQDADWDEDIAGNEDMNQGDARIFYYDPGYRYYNIKIILKNDKEYILPKVDFSDAWRMSIWHDGKKFQVSKNARG